MQIVINISKGLYDRYKEKDHIKKCDIDEFEKALDRCVILPKGHGRLIDADAVLVEPFGNTYKDIDIAETIIEADRSEE